MQGFIQLTPKPLFNIECPECRRLTHAHDWALPGLWVLAKYRCEHCGAEFFFDLPYSYGVIMPCYLDLRTSKAKPKYLGDWYAWLKAKAWTEKTKEEVSLAVERKAYGQNVCIVNCLYTCWGDAVGSLLRVNRLKDVPGMDIVVVINPPLLWLVSDFVRGVWVIEQDIADNWKWNESIDAKVKAVIREQNLNVFVPIIFQPAYLTPAELHEACKIRPFPRDEWTIRLKEKAVVTFMSRMDRTWSRSRPHRQPSLARRVLNRILRPFSTTLQRLRSSSSNAQQLKNIINLARQLKRGFPDIEFAVCGIGRQGPLPAWVKDLRVEHLAPDTNRIWAEQAARSHVLVGVHGSNLSLFASLAGSCVELTPTDFLKMYLGCSQVTSRQPRESLYCYRFLPADTSAQYLADLIGGILLNYPYASMAYGDDFDHPLSQQELSAFSARLTERNAVIQAFDKDCISRLGFPI
jgi:hypothetical protein